MKLFSFLKNKKENNTYKGSAVSKMKAFFNGVAIKKVDDKSIDYLVKDRMINLLIKTNIVTIIVCLVLISGYPALFPLKQVIPYLVQFSTPQERIVTVEQATLDIDTDKALREKFVRDYVVRRRSISLMNVASNKDISNVDLDKLEDYASVILMSDQDVKDQFMRDYAVNNPQSRYLLALQNNYTVHVYIKRSTLINDKQAQVNFVETYADKNTGKSLGVKEYVATITMERKELKFQGYDYLKNPYGLIVVNWAISDVYNYTGDKNDN